MDMFAVYGSEYATLRTMIVYSPQEMGADEFQIQVCQSVSAGFSFSRTI